MLDAGPQGAAAAWIMHPLIRALNGRWTSRRVINIAGIDAHPASCW